MSKGKCLQKSFVKAMQSMVAFKHTQVILGESERERERENLKC